MSDKTTNQGPVQHRIPGVSRAMMLKRQLLKRLLLTGIIALMIIVVPVGEAGAQSFWDGLLTGLELMIGDSVADDVRAEYGPPARLPEVQAQAIDTVFQSLAKHARRQDIPYQLQVLESDVINAFAAPGGHIFITTELLHYIEHDVHALANVLGHEIAHVEHQHGMNMLGRRLGTGFLLQMLLSGVTDDDAVFETIAGVATELVHLSWSRDQEHESDELGQRLAARAGYDPRGMVRFFAILVDLEGAEIPFLEFLSTHPLTSERINRTTARAPRLMPDPLPITPLVPARRPGFWRTP